MTIYLTYLLFTMDTTKEYYDEFDIQNSLNLEMVDSSIILDLFQKQISQKQLE